MCFFAFFKQNPLPVTQCILEYLIPERGLKTYVNKSTLDNSRPPNYELLISNMHQMHNKLEEDTCENVEVIAPTRSNY